MTALLLLLAGPREGYAQTLPAPDPERAVTQYMLESWTTENGLPVNTVNTVLQTRDGYIWFATQEGLVRFNGHALRVFDRRTANLPSSTIHNLYEDRAGTLWIGTRGGGLIRYDGRTFTAYGEEDGLRSLHISAVVEDARGRLWVGTTQDGLHRFDNGRFTAYGLSDGLPSENINTLFADDEGNVWIGTRDAGLVRYDGRRFYAFTARDGLPNDDISVVYEDARGGLWIGTRNGGLSVLRDGTFTTYTTENGLPSNSVFDVTEDAAGSLWIGSEFGGLTRFHDGEFETLTAEDGLSNNNVLSVLVDREGSLWAGTQNGGVTRLHAGKFVNYTTREGLVREVVYTVTQDTRGDLWFGTWEGGVSRLRDGRIRTFRTADGLPSDIILSVYGARDGSVWMGTRNDGLVRYQNGAFRTFTEEDGLPGLGVYSLFEDERGVLWMGVGREGLVSYRDGVFRTLTEEDGLSSNVVTAITEDASGDLWVGTYDGGLNRLRDGRVVEHYGTEHGMQSEYVLSLHADDDGTLWIGTREGGLHRLRDGELAVITVEDGLFNDKITLILDDGRGTFWMGSNKGIFQVRRRELNAFADGEIGSVVSTVYDANDGLPTSELNGGTQPAGWRSADGRLWFPTAKGVASIDPAAIQANGVPPMVTIEQVLVEGEDVPPGPDVRLAPGRDRIEFHYAGLSYVAPEEVVYEYRLDGVDEEWVAAGTRREAFYTNLSPGAYTFRVRARNGDGVWSEQAAEFTFYLEPFFWQTTWFYILCALALLGAGIGAYRLRVHQLTMRQRELEETVLLRTRDLREEKEKVERAKVTIEEQAEKLRELDKMKTQFFSNISHEFRTPLTLNIGPLENALVGLYGTLSPQMKKQVEIMLRNSRRLLRLINQLLDISKLEMGRMRLTRRYGDLLTLISGIVYSFSSFVEKKGMEMELFTEQDELAFYFDSASMEKVFFNLLSNAIKFTPDGGRITVSVKELPAPTPEGPAQIEVRVADTGTGIPADDLPYIFDRFHQAKGAVSSVQEGTGIGLALVKELVELHGGTITAESVVGEGTEFIILLPKVTEPEEAEVPTETAPARTADAGETSPADEGVAIDAASAEPIPSQGAMLEVAVFEGSNDEGPAVSETSGDGDAFHLDGERPEILVVDDNPDIRAYMTGCLESRYRIRTASNGEEGLAEVRRRAPDLIVSDLMMPKMNGYELCRAIRSDEALQHLPIIMVTSKTSLDNKIEGLEAGVDDYLPKPFNAEELLVRVRNLLKLRSHEKALQETNVALGEANEVKSQMLRIAAHDLRNPLNNIREFSKIVREEVDDDSDAVQLLELIEKSSNQMLQLITQMLEAERLESGGMDLDKKPLDLAELAEAIVARNRIQAEAKGQEIILGRDEDECVVEASDEWLNEALENILTNAIKYAPPGSTIHVDVTREEDRALFAVKDEGPGLTDEDKKKLFQKFQRLSARPTGGESSTGLGLSIVKHIVELHEGRVWAESEVGKGSTFFIELPCLPQPLRV